jgi:CubicO group peptidase (beta-lactamase class C family)
MCVVLCVPLASPAHDREQRTANGRQQTADSRRRATGHRPLATDDYFPSRSWRRASPKSQGLDGKILKRLRDRIRSGQLGRIDSFLVVRNGYLVAEEYYNGWGVDDLHTLQSDTKSITSLLVGIAIGRGLVGSVEDRVLDYFPEYGNIRNLDARKRAMRVEDLLTMRTGLDWREAPYVGSPLHQMNTSREDWLKFVLDWPMREQPGTRFEYNSGGTILLGGIVRNASGLNVDRFAERYLFDPLRIDRVQWFYGFPDDLPHTGGGLSMRPRDMAKIGYLLLRGGRWKTRQVVPEKWIRSSTARIQRPPWSFGAYPVHYGYLWWLLPLDGTGADTAADADVLTASGAQGQWIFAIPRYDMVVVATGESLDYRGFIAPVEFLYSDVLRAVVDVKSPRAVEAIGRTETP